MAKFKYSLEKVLNHRRIQENLAQRDFQEQMMMLNQEIEKLKSFEENWSQAHQQMHAKQVRGGSTVGDLQAINEFLKGLKIKIERQKLVIVHHEKLVEEVREFLRQRMAERQMIDSHKENKRLEFKKEQAKKEQKEYDDQATIRFTRKSI